MNYKCLLLDFQNKYRCDGWYDCFDRTDESGCQREKVGVILDPNT